MLLPVTRRYKLPLNGSLHLHQSFFQLDMLPAIRSAEDILAEAKIHALQLHQDALEHAQAYKAQVESEADQLSTDAAIAAQRAVWLSVLKEWQFFVAGLQAQHDVTREMLQMLCSMVLKKLRTNLSAEEKLESSITWALDHWIDSRRGELCVHLDDIELAQDILQRTKRHGMQVKADASVAKGACVLRCGDLSFATDFFENMDVLMAVLHDALQVQQ